MPMVQKFPLFFPHSFLSLLHFHLASLGKTEQEIWRMPEQWRKGWKDWGNGGGHVPFLIARELISAPSLLSISVVHSLFLPPPAVQILIYAMPNRWYPVIPEKYEQKRLDKQQLDPNMYKLNANFPLPIIVQFPV
jgi:hypothetical protein